MSSTASTQNTSGAQPRPSGLRPWKAGQSGNPGGRPKVSGEIRDLARTFGPDGIRKLAEMAGLTPGIPAEAEATRVSAIKELLDRGYGKAAQPITDEDGNSPVMLHLLAVREVGRQLLEERATQPPPTIQHEPITNSPASILDAPPPLE